MIKMPPIMWDEYRHPPKQFYRRGWFFCLLILLVTGVSAAAVYWAKMESDFKAQAGKFDYSKIEEMESASVIYDRNNAVLARIYLENRDTVPFSELPLELTQAVIAAEDNRFYQHHGADYYGMFRAAVRNWQAGRIRQGASTLTQQLARNTFPKELPSNDRSYHRKILEIYVAQEIESRFPKNKILEYYLNRVYFGSGFYGAEAASLGYFGKRAKQLNISECATLAGLLKNPNNLSPWSNRQACMESRNLVLGRMAELKYITPVQYQQILHDGLLVKNRRKIQAESYAIDMVRQQVIAQVGLENAVSDGFRIYTTIDPELQRKAEESLKSKLVEMESRQGYSHPTYAQYDAMFKQRRKQGDDDSSPIPSPEYLQTGFIALDNSNAAILAIIGGRDFSHSQFNRVTLSARPAGTAFIPLVYAAAFEKEIFPGTLFDDSVMDNRQVMIGGVTGILGEWGPESVDNRYEGPIPAREALVKSKNAATVRLGMTVGVDNVITLAKSAGITKEMRHYPATLLGSSEVTLMDLTLAYTMFPNGGSKPLKPFIINRIVDRSGREIFKAQPDSKRVLSATTAYEINSCLADVLSRGTGDKAFSKYGLKKFPVGGKTGTAYNFTDSWFIGYSSAITCGIWMGFDKPQPIYRGAFSSDTTLPVWVDVMNSSFSKYKPKEFAQPAGLKRYEVCLSSGQLATEHCNESIQDKATGSTVDHRTTYFEIGTEAQAPKTTCTKHGEAVPGATAAQELQPKGASQWPRASMANDVSEVKPVIIKGPTLINEEDPYNSMKPTSALPATRADTGEPASGPPTTTGTDASPTPAPPKPDEPTVRKAEPVRPLEQQGDVSTIKIEPPPALDF